MSCSTETSFTSSPTPSTPLEVFAGQALAPTVLYLSAELRQKLVEVVEASYPFEACGLMVGRTSGHRVEVEDVFYARNLNVKRARDRYLLAPQDYLAVDRVARQRGLDIVGFWHSHPDRPAQPSAIDLEEAWKEHSYLIVSTAAFGTNVFRSWRLRDGRFEEEKIRQP